MAADQGIMALPESAQMQQPQLGLDDAYDAVRSGVQESLPEAAGMLQQGMDQILPNLQEMSDENLDRFLQIVQYLNDNPEKYTELVAQLVQAGLVDEGDFPPEYDPEFLASLGAVILEARRSRGAAQPQQFAQGGLASLGRGNDTMLAHINPQEARMLKRHGGMGTINPKTGLPEYDFWSSLVKSVTQPFKSVVNGVKSVLKSPIGRILGTVALAAFLGPGALGISGLGLGAAAMPLASGAVTALTGGKLKDVLKSAAVGYLAGPTSPITGAIGTGLGALAPGLGNVAQMALSSGLAGTTVGLLSGQNLKQAVGSGLISGLGTYASANFGTKPPMVEGIERNMGTNAADVAALEAREAAINAGVTPGQPTGLGTPAETSPVPSRINTNLGSTSAPVAPPVTPGAAAQIPAPGAPAAPAAAPTAVAAPGGYQKPLGFVEGFERDGIMGGLKNAFMPAAPTEAQILASPELPKYQALGFKGNELMSKTAEAMGAPGAIRTYAPLAAAGLGIMGLSGGFKKPPVQLNASQQAMVDNIAAQRKKVEENPGAYTAKGLEKFGIKYNDKGEIVGSSPWSSPYRMNDVRVESNAFSPYMMTPSAPLTAYRGYAQGGTVDESFITDSDGQQIPISYGPPAPTEQPAPIAAATPAPANLFDTVGPPIPSTSSSPDWRFTPEQRRQSLQDAINLNKQVLSTAEFGSKKYTDALQALSKDRSALSAMDYELAHPAGVMSAAQTAGMAQGRDLAARMYPSLNPSAAAQMFPTMPRTTGRVPQPYNTSSMYSNLQPAPPRMPRGPITTMPITQPPVTQPPITQPPVTQPPVTQPPITQPPQTELPVTEPRRVLRNTVYPSVEQTSAMANGGIASLAQGGYPRMTGAINGPGTETSDSIPAMLSNNEFVFTAKAVRGAGGGSARQGAKRMYALMHQLERNAARG